jgi:hypothetical protein
MQKKFISLFLNEILEKYLRMWLFVVECERELPWYTESRLTTSLKSELQAQLIEILRLAQRFSRFQTLDADRVMETTLMLQEYAEEFERLHESLQWVSKPWVGEETYSFVADFFRDKHADEFYAKLNGSLSYMPIYNFWNYPVDVHFPGSSGGHRTIAWALPCAEQHNPLMWPIILHEIGHEIVRLEEIDLQACESFVHTPEFDKCRKWAGEIGADIIALELAGPAYLFPLISLAIFFVRQNLRMPQNRHPPPLARIELMIEHLKEMGLDPQLNKFKPLRFCLDILDERLNIDRLKRQLEEDEAQVAEENTKQIGKAVFNILRKKNLPIVRFSKHQYSEALLLAKKLSKGQMIASSRPRNAEAQVRERLKALAAGPTGETPSKKYEECIVNLNEHPARSCEIVMAGWLNKGAAKSILEQSSDKFGGQLLQDPTKSLHYYAEIMQDSDLVLEKSVEVSVVHSVFAWGGR